MTTRPQKSKNVLTKRSKTSKPKNYQDKLNKLREADAEFGRELHARIALAQEIYDDPEYREKMASMADVHIDAISPDALAQAIDDTWPKLIALGYDFLGTHNECVSLQAMLRAYPNVNDWANKTPVELATSITITPTTEKELITRRRATLKDLKERDDKIIKLEKENFRLKLELTQAQQRITELETENQDFRHILINVPDIRVA